MEAFAAATEPIAQAAKTAAVTLSAAFLSSALATPAPPIDASDVPVDFYVRKPFLATWKALNDNMTLEEAARIGLGQAEAAAANLITSSARQAGDLFISRTGTRITGWERTAEANCCPWCAHLDGVVFPTADSADFGHDRCHCVPVPLAA